VQKVKEEAKAEQINPKTDIDKNDDIEAGEPEIIEDDEDGKYLLLS